MNFFEYINCGSVWEIGFCGDFPISSFYNCHRRVNQQTTSIFERNWEVRLTHEISQVKYLEQISSCRLTNIIVKQKFNFGTKFTFKSVSVSDCLCLICFQATKRDKQAEVMKLIFLFYLFVNQMNHKVVLNNCASIIRENRMPIEWIPLQLPRMDVSTPCCLITIIERWTQA